MFERAFWLNCWASHSICRWELQHRFDILEKRCSVRVQTSWSFLPNWLIHQVQPRQWFVTLFWARKEKQWRIGKKHKFCLGHLTVASTFPFITGWFVLQSRSLLFVTLASFNLQQHLKAHNKGMIKCTTLPHSLTLCTCFHSWDGIFLSVSFSYFSHSICSNNKQTKNRNCAVFSYILLYIFVPFQGFVPLNFVTEHFPLPLLLTQIKWKNTSEMC